MLDTLRVTMQPCYLVWVEVKLKDEVMLCQDSNSLSPPENQGGCVCMCVCMCVCVCVCVPPSLPHTHAHMHTPTHKLTLSLPPFPSP